MRYLHDYASELNLNIQYNTEITLLTRSSEGYVMTDQYDQTYDCQVVIVRWVKQTNRYG